MEEFLPACQKFHVRPHDGSFTYVAHFRKVGEETFFVVEFTLVYLNRFSSQRFVTFLAYVTLWVVRFTGDYDFLDIFDF